MFDNIKNLFAKPPVNNIPPKGVIYREAAQPLTANDHKALNIHDGWHNLLTGLGSLGQDKATYTQSYWYRMPYEECATIYAGDALARKIIELVVNAALYHDYRFALEDKDEEENQDFNADVIKNINEKFDLKELIYTAAVWARIYGGAYLLVGAEDGQDVSSPLDYRLIKTVKYIQVFDPQEIFPIMPGLNPSMGSYLNPEYYTVATWGGTNVSTIHHSRIIRFDGNKLLRRNFVANGYIHDSVLNPIKVMLAGYHQAIAALNYMLQEWSVGIYQVKGLAEMISAGQEQHIVTRFSLIDKAKSLIRAIVVGDNESYTRESSQYSGAEAVVDTLRKELATQVNIPHTILFNEGAGRGELFSSGSGNSEQSDWQALVGEYQKHHLRKPLRKLYNILFSAQDNPITKGKLPEYDVHFTAARSLNMAEEAEAYNSFATADSTYLSLKVLSAQEIRHSRFGTSGTFSRFQNKIELDDSTLQEGTDEFNKAENEEAEKIKSEKSKGNNEQMNQTNEVKNEPKDDPEKEPKNEPEDDPEAKPKGESEPEPEAKPEDDPEINPEDDPEAKPKEKKVGLKDMVQSIVNGNKAKK